MANWVADFLLRNPDLAALPIYKRARHSLHFLRPDGQIEAHIVGTPIHENSTGEWLPVDTALKLIGSEYGARGLKPRISLDGTVRIDGGTYSHRSTRVGVFNALSKNFTANKTIPLGHVEDDTLVAESGVFKRTLRLTFTGLRENIVISALPTGLTQQVNDWLVLETIVTGVTFPDGQITGNFDKDGFRFPAPRTHDANKVEATCKRFAKTVGGVQYVYTGIPVSWLQTASYPVVIDPDFVGAAADGYIYGISGTYATARSTASGAYGDDVFQEGLQVGQATGYIINRGCMLHDTSAIGAGSTVTQANLKLSLFDDQSATNFDVQIIDCDWSAAIPLDDEVNIDTAFDGILAGTLDAVWRNTSGASLNTYYTSPNLGTAWVNKTGITYYGLLSSRDKAATTPTGAEFVYFNDQEMGVGYQPILVVTYSAGGGGIAKLKTWNGLALAKIKTINGLEIAKVKTINGLT